MKIMIVEDNNEARFLVKIMIKKFLPKTEIKEFDNSLEALSCPDLNNFDLLIIDIVMPQMSGFEFIEKYRAQGGKNIAIAITAAYTNYPPNIWKNFQAVLLKPFKTEDLKKEINRLL
jgi:two-component SAPR family response regulator